MAIMKRMSSFGLLLVGSAVLLVAQGDDGSKKTRPEDLPTANLISTAGASFTAPHVREATMVIVYGDQRFTDPNDTKVTNPKARRWLGPQKRQGHPPAG